MVKLKKRMEGEFSEDLVATVRQWSEAKRDRFEEFLTEISKEQRNHRDGLITAVNNQIYRNLQDTNLDQICKVRWPRADYYSDSYVFVDFQACDGELYTLRLRLLGMCDPEISLIKENVRVYHFGCTPTFDTFVVFPSRVIAQFEHFVHCGHAKAIRDTVVGFQNAYRAYPVQQTKQAVFTFLAIWRFRPDSILARMLPRDVAMLIARAIWETRKFSL